MEGSGNRAGAVAALQRVKNPDPRRAQGDGGDRPRDARGRGRAALRARHGFRRPRSGHARAARRLEGQEAIDEVLGSTRSRCAVPEDHPEYAGGTVGAAAVDSPRRARGGNFDRRRHAQARGPRGRFAASWARATTPRSTSRPRPREPVNTCCARSPPAPSPRRSSAGATLDDAVRGGPRRNSDASTTPTWASSPWTATAHSGRAHRTRDMPHAFFSAGAPVVSKMRV